MKILLAGYYGYSNFGDDMLCETTKQALLPIAKQIKILDRKKRKLKKIISLIKECDVLVFGGGSLLQDITGRGLTIVYYFLFYRLAKFFGKKVFFVAQGIGPVHRRFNLWLVKKALRGADYVSVRNKESAAFLMALGVKNHKVYNDLFFAYQVPKFHEKQKNNSDKKISVVFSFRPLAKDYQKQMYRLMKRIRDVLKYIDISVVPMQKGYDDKFLKVLKKIKGIKVIKYNKDQIFQTVAAADIVVGMRYHFLMLAAKYNIPFVGLVYDPKISGICSAMRMPMVHLSDLEKLGNVLIKEIPKIKIHKMHLKKSLKQEEEIAKKGLEELKEILINVTG